MLHHIFIWATWALAALGVGGAAALIVAMVTLGPAVVQAWLIPAVTRFLRCAWCVASVVFVLATTGAYWVGHHQAATECKAEQLAAALRNQEFDLAEAEAAKRDAETRAKKIEDKASERATADADYIKKLESKPACALDDNDVGAGSVPNDRPRARFPRFTHPAK